MLGAMGLDEEIPVQRAGAGGGESSAIHSAAAHGLSGSSSALPHREQIQRSFGPDHDVSGVSAHVGGPATAACDQMGASAYASGSSVAFRGAPDLHTAAHEVAHVVQQQQGVSLYGGVGEAGDVYERHADAVADRVVAGESAADLLSSGPSGSAPNAAVQRQVQRREATPGVPAAAAATDAAAATAPAPSASAGPNKTVPMLLSAIYEEVPGQAKETVRRAKEDEAVWLAPIAIYSNFPQEKRTLKHMGVVAGGGQKTIDEYDAPISEGAHANGRGSITAQLKYASDANKSFNVSVTGVARADVAGAEKLARTVIEREIGTLGDVEDVIRTAEQELHSNEKYKDAKVTVAVKNDKTTQEGSTTFNYKIRSKAGIRLDLLAQPVGEKSIKSGGAKTLDSGTQDVTRKKVDDSRQTDAIKREDVDKYKKVDTSTETNDYDYYEKVAKSVDDYVTKVTESKDTVLSNLAQKTVNHEHSDWQDKEVSHEVQGSQKIHTGESKHSQESGERDKENLAAKLRKGVKIAKDAIKIPYVDKIPVIGWLSRKVKGWQLDLLDAGLGLFEEKGKVKFVDTKLDEKSEDNSRSTTDATRQRDVTLTADKKEEIKRTLNEEFHRHSKDEWERHMKDLTEVRKSYRSKIKKDATTTVDKTGTSNYEREATNKSSQDETERRAHANQTTVATFEATSVWKFSKPLVKATVVSGNAEVKDSSQPFGPEDDELASGPASK